MVGLRNGGDGERAHDAASRNFGVLCETLLILATDTASRSARQDAARALLRQLRTWRPGYLLRLHSWLTPASLRRDTETLLEDAIQHVAVMASTGNARFRGTTPGEAVVWCRTVLDNHLRSELRQRSRLASASEVMSARGGPPGSWRDARLVLQEFDRTVRKHLQRTRRPQDVKSLYRSVCCYFEHLAGVPFEVQLERWAEEDLSEPRQLGKARNRIYQYHHRGRRVLAEVLGES